MLSRANRTREVSSLFRSTAGLVAVRGNKGARLSSSARSRGRTQAPIPRAFAKCYAPSPVLLKAPLLGSQRRAFSNEVKSTNPDLRNFAIIAHVDHGKTTLVDGLLRQSSLRKVEGERVMDSNALERERGITILSKCTSIEWEHPKEKKVYQLNIVDTPGHADFGGEVERIMTMVDGVALVVDASEGPMAQTKFVLSKALARGLKPLVVINKVDRPTARLGEVENEVLDLFCNLGASDEQLDFPIIYASGRDGWAVKDMGDERAGMAPLFEMITEHVPPPTCDANKPFSMLVTQIQANAHFGKCLLGKIHTGKVKAGDTLQALDPDSKSVETIKVLKVLGRRGMDQIVLEEAVAGDIVALAGFDRATVNSTLCDASVTEAIPSIPIDPPTLSMTFGCNTSPLAGQEGKAATAGQLRDRLMAEGERNVAIKVVEATNKEYFEVRGRGELQLGVLIEEIRREGLELSVYPPKVVFQKKKDGQILEPIEEVIMDVDQEFTATIMQKMQARKGEMVDWVNSEDGTKSKLRFLIPTRGLIGYRSEFTNDTRGSGIFNQLFHSYQPYKGAVERVMKGALISNDQGPATAHALGSLESRGTLFIIPGAKCYLGMVIGENAREEDLDVNPVRTKALSNVRSVSKDEKIRLAPPKIMTLEEAISYVRDDEVIEVTPQSIRLRKKLLEQSDRKKSKKVNQDLVDAIIVPAPED